jgi:hypothetical protein
MKNRPYTQQEIVLAPSDTIQSRTDLRGVITYANPTFARISGYTSMNSWARHTTCYATHTCRAALTT